MNVLRERKSNGSRGCIDIDLVGGSLEKGTDFGDERG